MPEIIKGRNIKVEVAATFATAKVVTAITKASPGVATSNAHGLLNGTVGYFKDVEGMAQLEGQACRVSATAANTFELQGLNTSNFSAFTDQADFITAATWLTLAECTSYQIPDGTADKLDTGALIDVAKKEENGFLAAQSITLSVLAKTTPSAAMQIIESAAQAGGNVLVRITLNDGAVRIAYGEPSTAGENVQKGQVGTGSLTIAVKGFVLKLA